MGNEMGNDRSTTETVRVNMPSRQDQLQFWLLNFASAVSEDPARYRLTPGDAAKLMQHAQAFDDAMHRVNNRSTATQPATKAKDEAKAAAKAVFREYANRIKDDPLISIADKLNLGMKQTETGRSTAALRYPPILNVGIAPPTPPEPGKASVESAHLLRFADSHAPHRRAKPEGAGYLELRIIISRSAVIDPDTPASDDVIVRTEKLTRNPSTIKHDPALGNHAGLTATYFGRWSTKSKRNPITSPWSSPVAMTVVTITGN